MVQQGHVGVNREENIGPNTRRQTIETIAQRTHPEQREDRHGKMARRFGPQTGRGHQCKSSAGPGSLQEGSYATKAACL
eukprot:6836506-Pyramimonas_sp.AAC.1